MSTKNDAVAAPRGTDKTVRRIFNQLVKTLPEDRLTPADLPMLVQLAEALMLRQQAFDALLQEGLLTEDKRHGGQAARHPALVAWKQTSEQVLALSKRFGLSPKDREALAGGDVDGKQITVAELLEAVVGDDG